MGRRVFVTAVIGLLTVFALAGSSWLDGALLFVVSGSHGVHVADLPLVALAGLASYLMWRR